MAKNDKKSSESSYSSDSKYKNDLNIDNKETEKTSEKPTEKALEKKPVVRPAIDISNPVTIGAFFSTSREIRKIEGFKYLKGAFEKKAKDFPYRQSLSKWEFDFNKFLKG